MSETSAQPVTAPWLPELAPSFLSRAWRCVTLLPRLWRPWRLWKFVDAQTPVSWTSLAMFLTLIVLLRLLMGVAGAGDDLAFSLRDPPSGDWSSAPAQLAREIAYPGFTNKSRQDGALDPHWLAGPIAAHLAFVLMLLLLGKDRRRVGVTAAHLARAWVYGLAWLGGLFLLCAIAGALDAGAYAAWVYSDFDPTPSWLESVASGVVRATESPIVLALIAVWILVWWRSAIVTAWKIPRGHAGWALISAVALVVGAAAILLTRHIHTLRVIAEG